MRIETGNVDDRDGRCGDLSNWRTAMQQRLRALLSVSGSGFVRYVWGAPIAFSAVAVIAISGHHLPMPSARFWPLIAGGGVAQIVATIFLISAFDASGFAVGTVYSKTEVVQVAVFSAVLLDETLRPFGWLATVLCLSGVVLLAGGRTLLRHPDRAALFGLLAGTGFGLAAVGIRAATQSLGDAPAFVRAIVALAVMNTMQTVIHGGYLAVRERRTDSLGLPPLAVEFGGRRAQRVRFSLLCLGVRPPERCKGPHLWSSRVAVHVLCRPLVAPRTQHPARIRRRGVGARRGARRHDCRLTGPAIATSVRSRNIWVISLAGAGRAKW